MVVNYIIWGELRPVLGKLLEGYMSLESWVNGTIAGLKRLTSPEGLAHFAFVLVLIGVGPTLIFLEDPELFVTLPVSKLLLLGVMLTATPVALIVSVFSGLGTKDRPNLGVEMGAVAGITAVGACAFAAVAATHLPEVSWLPLFKGSVIMYYSRCVVVAIVFLVVVAKIARHDAKKCESANG